jgi:sugar phosphate isomerase/epimerase
VLDTFHFFVGGSQLQDFRTLPVEKIFLVHVSDAMDVSLEELKTRHDCRTFPGCGTINYALIFQQLDRLGYHGAISLEVWNQQLMLADPIAVVRRGFESLLGLERRLLTGKTASQDEPQSR